jgi:hypothetical protein
MLVILQIIATKQLILCITYCKSFVLLEKYPDDLSDWKRIKLLL